MTEGSPDFAPLTRDGTGSSLRELQEQLDRFWPGRLAAQSIGRFEVLEELGRGSYGTVFRVRDRNLGCERALKVPNPETLASPRALDRFIGEACKASRIDHANVVRVFEADSDCVIPYIVMEYCSEGSLAGWLAQLPADFSVSAPWAAALVAEIADGVHQAHIEGVLHRDLKPGNILLTRIGEGLDSLLPTFRPKVSDFGLARVLESDAGLARLSSRTGLIGTLPYMSPEQARGDAAVRAAADVYSLGIVLFELVTRGRPFSGSNDAEVLGRLRDDAPTPSPRTIRPDIPRDLETVCRTALAKAPGDRYQSAAQFADDLRRFTRGEPVNGSAWWKRARAEVHRRRSYFASLGMVVLFVGIAATGLDYKFRKEASVWLARLAATDVASLPELIAERDPPDPRLIEPLTRMFKEEGPSKKLAAALALASSRRDCARYGYERLLKATPEEISPIVRCLDGRMTDLLPSLEYECKSKNINTLTHSVSHEDSESVDSRRANAAVALVILGQHDSGFRLLRFAPDPQARSFLVHRLGPAGIVPGELFVRLRDEPDVSIRRALILALGEVADAKWDEAIRDEIKKWLLDRYEHDPDSGVHGAVKWLLGSWGLSDLIREVDARLASTDRSNARSWRIGTPLELTLVRYKDARTGRVIEIADTEITVAQILRWRKVPYRADGSPGPNYPINGTTYLLAAEFLNWLSLQDGIASDQYAYKPGKPGEPPFVPADNQLDRMGYRLLTDREFEQACRAETTTSRYYGTSAALLSRYAWCSPTPNDEIITNHVGRLKPNELGLFDMLGNVAELCQSSEDEYIDPWNQVVACGGSLLQREYAIKSDRRTSRTRVEYSAGSNDFGFRVARTVKSQE
jgi:hypothetical protein